MSKRRLNDWISSYLTYVEDVESPTSYHIWTALGSIAGALERRVYALRGGSRISPNQYIVLVGPSGRARKGASMEYARPLLEDVGVRLAPEQCTPSAIIGLMADDKNVISYFSQEKEGQRLCFQTPYTCFAEELAVLLGQKNTDFLALLTNWYDNRPTWQRLTRKHKGELIVGPCFNLIAATAPDWLPYMFTKEAIGGGWMARTIFVVEERKRKIVAWPNPPDPKLKEDLTHDLEQIRTLSGELEFAEGAVEDYETWYVTEEQKMMEGAPSIPDPRLAGYNARRATHLWKVAMAVSASRSNDLLVTKRDFARAKLILESTEKKMPRVFGGIGSAPFAQATDAVLQFIMDQKRCTRAELLNALYGDIDMWILEKVEKVLEEMGAIRRIISGSKTSYEYIGADDRASKSD